MRYLLDTNTVIAWRVKGDRAVIARVAEQRREIAVSAIVMHELYFGAFNSRRRESSLADLKAFGIPILPFEDADARVAGEIRGILRRVGTPIGPYDLLIAGQALARDLTLVTGNTREFARVKGLRLEDWTR